MGRHRIENINDNRDPAGKRGGNACSMNDTSLSEDDFLTAFLATYQVECVYENVYAQGRTYETCRENGVNTRQLALHDEDGGNILGKPAE